MQLANALLDQELVASANILPGVHSLYTWQGERSSTSEALLLAKTRGECFDRLVSVVQDLHPYEVPAIIALPILMGHRDYLDWIDRAVASAPHL
jgi:periplasmic divalent cation tolerance protein